MSGRRRGTRSQPYLEDRPLGAHLHADGPHRGRRVRRHGDASGNGLPEPCARRATAPGSPTAMCPTAGFRSRRSPAPSMPSSGRRRSMPSAAAITTLVIEERPEPPMKEIASRAQSPCAGRAAGARARGRGGRTPKRHRRPPPVRKEAPARAEERPGPRCSCPTGRRTILAWRRPRPTRARPRSSACGRRKSAEGDGAQRAVGLHRCRNGIKSRPGAMWKDTSRHSAAVAQG